MFRSFLLLVLCTPTSDFNVVICFLSGSVIIIIQMHRQNIYLLYGPE